jgi:hypothetical protein
MNRFSLTSDICTEISSAFPLLTRSLYPLIAVVFVKASTVPFCGGSFEK